MSACRVYPCLCVDDVVRAIDFYRALLGLDVVADAGWYAELARGGEPAQVAFVARGHATVPSGCDAVRGGVLVSVIVSDATAIHARALAMRAEVVLDPRDEEFGQRHFMVLDPDGFVVDVIEQIPPSVSFRRQLVEGRRRWR
jgi:catechol 2,3-dioxygenase-like lactoylglutathione lyase family enzyme